MMQEGMLYIDGKQGDLVLISPHRERIVITPQSTVEIKFGTSWLRGIFKPDYDHDENQVEPYNLFCLTDDSFLGLHSGMRARVEV